MLPGVAWTALSPPEHGPEVDTPSQGRGPAALGAGSSLVNFLLGDLCNGTVKGAAISTKTNYIKIVPKVVDISGDMRYNSST